MKKIKILIISLLILTSILFVPILNANGLAYTTFTFTHTQYGVIPTQDAYMPLSIQYDLGGLTLENPSDITIDNQDNLYIADYKTTGSITKGYILKYNLEDNTSSIIGEDILEQPTGVHIGVDGNVYVTDIKTKKAYQFEYNLLTSQYEVKVTYEKPTNSPYFGPNDVFEPSKIITDKGNVVYILLAGNINGLGKFENSGRFTGFFGGNQLPQTFENMVRSIFFNEQQRRDWFKMIPKPLFNIGVDNDGLILTVTKGVEGYLKLNIANLVYSSSDFGFNDLEDIFVGPSNTIFTVDKQGYITEYSPAGDPLFVFSGLDEYNQKGLLKNPSGIAVDAKNNLFVIDKNMKAIQIFVPTEFGNLVHHAIELYEDGRYIESREPWQKVLKMNAMFDLANKGIADAYFAEGDYENARLSYEVARDVQGYSDSYWEVRNDQLLKSSSVIITALIIFIVLFIINKFFNYMKYIKYPFKKANQFLSRFRVYKELKYGFYIFKKPEDGFYGIKREHKSSNLTALILYLLAFIAYIYWIYNTSFIFNNLIPSEINIMQQVVTIFGPIGLFVLANYLVCSIRDGEGKLSDLFQATAYLLIPLIITLPILTVISNYLTLNESFIYDFILGAVVIVTLVYVILMVKEIHFYDLAPTLSNILITIFTAIMLVVFAAIIYLLLNEVFGLISDIIREVIYRV